MSHSSNQTTESQLVVVDDSIDHLELMEDAVASLKTPCERHFFQRGEEAIDFLKKQIRAEVRNPKNLLFLTDWKLSTVSAEDLIQQIRALPAKKFTPIVVISSSRQASDIKRAYEAGASSFVCKPVSFDSYREVMRALCDYWLGINEQLTQ